MNKAVVSMAAFHRAQNKREQFNFLMIGLKCGILMLSTAKVKACSTRHCTQASINSPPTILIKLRWAGL